MLKGEKRIKGWRGSILSIDEMLKKEVFDSKRDFVFLVYFQVHKVKDMAELYVFDGKVAISFSLLLLF